MTPGESSTPQSGPGGVLTVRPTRLSGTVRVSGAKNSALRLLVASLLTEEPVRLSNFPGGLSDVGIQCEILRSLGKQVVLSDDRCEIVEDRQPVEEVEVGERSIRNTLLVLGALLARVGRGRVPLPGGCEIGSRPYDLHEALFEALGTEVWVEGDYLCAQVRSGRLSGGRYESPLRSTGVTENAILCGSLCSGTVELINPHLTPEVLDLVGFMRMSGVRIDLEGSSMLRVHGLEKVHGASWEVVPDRIEAVTWAAGAVATRGEIEIIDFPKRDASVALEYLIAAGARIYNGLDSVIVKSDGAQPFQLSAGAHPAVHSDMQPLFGLIASLATGTSEIVDLRYPERFGYLTELQHLGGRSEVDGGRARIFGGGFLRGGRVDAGDLRAGAALMLAGCAARDEVYIENAWQIVRGYDRVQEKLKALGGGAVWCTS